MDHVPLPLNHQNERVDVTYICKEDFDNAGFLSYPNDTVGQTTKRFAAVKREVRRGNATVPTTASCTHAAVKESMILRRIRRFSSSGFSLGCFSASLGSVHKAGLIRKVRTEDGRKMFLSTEKLLVVAAEWLALGRLPVEEQDTLREAHSVYLFICVSSNIDPLVLLSIGVLGEFLVSTGNRACRYLFDGLTEWHPGQFGMNSLTAYITSSMLATFPNKNRTIPGNPYKLNRSNGRRRRGPRATS